METNTKVTRGARRRRNSGLSLIELLVAIALLGLFISLGTPSLGRLIEQRRLDGAADRLTTGIRLAREAAISGNVAVVMAPTDGDWNAGWRVYIDENRNGLPDTEEQLLQEDHAAGLAEISATGELARYLRYNPLGESERLDGGFLAGTLHLCPADLTRPGRRLVINRVGRLRSESAHLTADTCAGDD